MAPRKKTTKAAVDAPAEAEAPLEISTIADDAAPEGVGEQPVELEPEAPVAMPSQISDMIPPETPEATRHRVEIWLAETKYFFSTLEHDVGGDAGALIAYIKARL